jgi:hypothetical protein
MHHLKWVGICCSFLFFSAVRPGHAAPASVVQLSDGVTHADISGDGQKGMIVKARRENFNAHGFDVISFYIQSPLTDGGTSVWNIVPVFTGNKEMFEVTVSGGADCVLHDFRLVKSEPGNGVRLIIANREIRESYFEESSVTFEYYTLNKNNEGEVGVPRYYFEKTSTSKAKGKYCDVGEAFMKELGLSGYGKNP